MMNESDLKRNASGYYDEPCYKACTALPKAGEIWADSNGYKHWLVICGRDTVCSTLLLDTKEKENSIMVMGRVPMYTDPIMIGYTFTDKMAQFVKTVKAEEMNEVKIEVAKALGFEAIHAVAMNSQAIGRERDMLKEKVETLTKERDDALHEVGNMQIALAIKKASESISERNIDEMNQEITKLNIYKDMYMNLIDKLVSVRGAVND